VSFAPDGKRILSASNDSTAKIYTCGTCVPLGKLRALVAHREHVIDANGR
jgi:WD40 repeat protein